MSILGCSTDGRNVGGQEICGGRGGRHAGFHVRVLIDWGKLPSLIKLKDGYVIPELGKIFDVGPVALVEGVELGLVHYKSVMDVDGGVEFGHTATDLVKEPQAVSFVAFRFKIRPDKESGVKGGVALSDNDTK